MVTPLDHIPDAPTDSVDYFRPAPLPRVPFPYRPDEGYLVLLRDAPSLSLEQVDALAPEELERLALSPLELVVGGIATAGSLLGRGLLADARERFAANASRDEYGWMTVGLMFLESGSGEERRTYRPTDLVLQSAAHRQAGDQWRPWCAKRFPDVPERWLQI